jgi:hypothetical protein
VRISTIAIVGAFAIAVINPALAQKSRKRTACGTPVGTFEKCESRPLLWGCHTDKRATPNMCANAWGRARQR